MRRRAVRFEMQRVCNQRANLGLCPSRAGRTTKNAQRRQPCKNLRRGSMPRSPRQNAPAKSDAPMQKCTTFVGVDAHIDPHAAHPFYDTLRQTRNCPTGGQRRPPLRVRACAPRRTRSCDVLPRGRGRTPPLRQRGKILWIRIGAFQFAGAYRTILSSRLRRATSLYTREALVRSKRTAAQK